MKLSENLNDFNRSMAEELRGTFASNVKPFETEEGYLVFRGPIEGHSDPNHIGTHVAVSLTAEVQRALAAASHAEREEMTKIFLSNLGTRVKCEYHPRQIGPCALDIVGTMNTLRG